MRIMKVNCAVIVLMSEYIQDNCPQVFKHTIVQSYISSLLLFFQAASVLVEPCSQLEVRCCSGEHSACTVIWLSKR